MSLSRSIVKPASHAAPAGNYSTAIRTPLSGEAALLSISGQVAKGRDGMPTALGDAGKQTEVIFDLVSEILDAAGGTIDDLVGIVIHIVDRADFQAVKRVRDSRVGDPPPTSSIVQVSGLASPEFLVEVTATAVLSTTGGEEVR
ncbi:RidA family protein [Nocardia sp. CDC159]|uniref:RidA family protein n=1 Tax=Nocardia pulmonis TaxID=2951408 RepID=A0A9X2E847_9NOCA|nr:MULTISPECIES: RidA family protein [Nocardia]MCM6775892.1 RidA family protein [Nocardia pulmonis]MCM6788132.1 RidA family protein [Nocardia sp. CDC159]